MPARPEELEAGRELNREDGILFVGDKGKMLVEGWGGHSPRLIPEQRMQRLPAAAQDLAAFHRPSPGMVAGLQEGHADRVRVSTLPAR